MCQIEAPQKRIRCELRRAENVAAAISFHFTECNQLTDAPIEIAPHPVMHGPQHAIDETA